MQFSLRYIFVVATLICASLGTGLAVLPYSNGVVAILVGLFAAEIGLATLAAGERFFGVPLAMRRETVGYERRLAVGSMAVHVVTLLMGGIFLLIGGLGAAIIVDDNLTMDTKGATPQEWRLGATFIIASVISGFARGTSLIAMNALWVGLPLRGIFANYVGLGIGSWMALIAWSPAHRFGSARAPDNLGMGPDLHADYGNLVAGIVALGALSVGWLTMLCFMRKGMVFSSRARQLSGCLYLVGLFLGPMVALAIPAALSFAGKPIDLILVGAFIGANVGGLTGMLFGATKTSESQEYN